MFKTKGMNQDLSVSAFNPEFSFENMNLRLSTSEGNTMLSWVNEKGPAEIKDILIEVVEDGYTAESYTINGKPVGYAILNHKLIVFTTQNIQGYTPEEIEEENAQIRERNEQYANNPVYEPDPELEFDDYIYSLNIEPRTTTQEDPLPYKLVGKLLYKGHLYFSTKYPIETCVSYESEDIQKVYWTDGLNQPRMINIAEPIVYGMYNDDSFNFVGKLQLQEEVSVQKVTGNGGAFPSGVIQYAFTYYKKNGRESNIFYTTPLLYISPRDRGAAQDEKVDNVFKITVENLDTNYDYLRIYSIIRTSINSTPLCKRIQDLQIEKNFNVQQEELLVSDQEYGFLKYSNPASNVEIRTGTTWRTLSQYANQYDSAISDTSVVLYTVQTDGQPNQSYTLGNLSLYGLPYDRVYTVDQQDALIKISSDLYDNDVIKTRYITYKNYNNNSRFYILEQDIVDQETQELQHRYKIIAVNHSQTESSRELKSYLYNDSIEPKENKLTYSDTGYSGDAIDPTELLYKGGEGIIAETLEQKDGTLFLGNITIPKKQASEVLSPLEISKIPIDDTYRIIYPEVVSKHSSSYGYSSQLTAFGDKTIHGEDSPIKPTTSVPCGGFKHGNTYRCGLQFQDSTGKWGDPVYIRDVEITTYPEFLKEEVIRNASGLKTYYPERIKLPGLVATINERYVRRLKSIGYKKVRAVIAVPSLQDRTVLCQGVINPTLFTDKQRTSSKGLYAQSSWFFRPNQNSAIIIDEVSRRQYDRRIEGNDREEAVNLTFKIGNVTLTNTVATNTISTGEYQVTYDSNSDSYYITVGEPSQQIEVVGWSDRAYQEGTLYVLSTTPTGTVTPKSQGTLNYTQRNVTGYVVEGGIQEGFPDSSKIAFNPQFIRSVEIEGDFNPENKFNIDWECATFHSPDVEFDDQIMIADFTGKTGRRIGKAVFDKTLSSIDIQTETPTVGVSSGGFVPMSFVKSKSFGIVSGLFYEDWAVEDWGSGDISYLKSQKTAFKWLVYPWNSNGSINNDFNRKASQGVQSTILKKKVISNLRYASTMYTSSSNIYGQDSASTPRLTAIPQVFSSNETTIVKLGSDVYQGNIDTLLLPDNYDGVYFTFEGDDAEHPNNTEYIATPSPFTSTKWWKTFNKKESEADTNGLWRWNSTASHPEWERTTGDAEALGNQVVGLVVKREPVRMRYKSSPHIVFKVNVDLYQAENSLPIIEFLQNTPNRYGGNTQDALRENVWIPCGEPVKLQLSLSRNVKVYYDYGDTYFQRWDCLKTYAFTPEDINQIVEIGSFMLETYVNIDGRYDRNRGQISNINVSPTNFNLMNPVYSQLNNFFSYKIGSYAGNGTKYPNQITWTKTKEAGADVDLWTNITLASILELDGDKGDIKNLIRFNDSLLAFQDTGIAQILYNERAQISTEDGVPIELANSGKVEGKRYISDTVGCSNKWSMINTPQGIYFMDSIGKSIYLFNGQLENLSLKKGMDSWCKKNIKYTERGWDWEFNDFIAQYDKKNQDVLFISQTQALAYSEKFDTFTSFYSYGDCPYLCWLDEYGIWLNRTYDNIESEKEITVPYMHQMGDYCTFFNDAYGYPSKGTYSMTLIGNPEPTVDKTFTTLEFRSCIDGDGIDTSNKFNFYLPFNTISVWNEYQHGKASLQQKNGFSGAMHHLKNGTSALKRKFRIWRCDIPRDNVAIRTTAPAALPSGATSEQRAEYNAELLKYKVYQYELSRGIFRTQARPLDRIRNPWIYINLEKDNIESDSKMHKVEIHDIVLTYFD